MKKEKIEVIVPCGQNSDQYVAKYIKSALETCSDDYELVFSLGINNYPAFDFDLLKFVTTYATIKMKTVNTDTEPGSVGHALVLQSLYDDVDADYCLVADCDLLMLKKHWDKIMVSKLSNDTVIVGTDYYQFSNLPKYVNFPALVLAIFKKGLLEQHKISFMPHENKGAHLITTQEEAVAYGRPRGSNVYLDVGYQFPLKLRPFGYNGYCIQFTKPTVLGAGQEFHFERQPFVTHMKGSSVFSMSEQMPQFWSSQAEYWNTSTKQKIRIIP